jgi:hypothetical protein
MIEVKAYTSKSCNSFGLYTIGHIDENDSFIFLNEETKKECFESLKKEFSYEGSIGATITIPDFKENKNAKTPEEIWRNEYIIRRNAEMVADDGYILAYKNIWPEVEDGKKYILTYRTEKIEDFDDEDELNHLS